MLLEFSLKCLHNYFIEGIVLSQLLRHQRLVTRRESDDLKRIVLTSHQIADHSHNAARHTKVILFSSERRKIFVVTECCDYSDQTLFFDFVLGYVQLLQTDVSFQNLGDFTTSSILQTILR